MTSPVAPSTAPVVPAYPALGSPSFNAEAYAVGTAMPGVVDGINDLAGNAFTNATSAHEDAITAQGAAVTATTASNTALSASNFKGEWSSLTGALTKPACVKHSGRFWMLLNNLANVAASAPSGANADWTSMDSGTVPTAVITTNTTGVVGVRYLVAANGVTLTAPASYTKGDFHGVRWMTGCTGGIWNFGSTPLRGLSAGALEIDVDRFGMDLYYEDATRGLI